jgi:ABC-type branched-subunit amino acid transport system ATPase component
MRGKLTSLGVRGFKALRNLEITGLGAVNLFVGKNNTGKTTVLEALQVYFSSDRRSIIFEMLTNREEFALSRGKRASINAGGAVDAGPTLAFEALFSGRPDIMSMPGFAIGPATDPQRDGVSVEFVWLQLIHVNEEIPVRYSVVRDLKSALSAFEIFPGFQIRSDGKTSLLPLDRLGRIPGRPALPGDLDQNLVYLPSSGMSMQEIGQTWDSIALTDDEDEVVKALQIVASDLEKIVLVQSPQRVDQRMLMAKLSGFAHPVPFKSLGEGTVHLLGLVLAIIQARDGVVLLDEIENGVHYSVQESMWKLIMDQSSKLNVQVFATTHSWDCVKGFQAAVAASPATPARLFRLEQNGDRIRGIAFTSEEVGIATAENIEIR